MAINKILKQCTICGEQFTPKTVNSIYCSDKCSDAAYRKKKAQKKQEEKQKTVIDKISIDRIYISVPEAVILYGVSKSTLYRFIRRGLIPAINLGTRLVRIERVALEQLFSVQQTSLTIKEKPTTKLYSLEPADCYTIGEIAQKFGISESSVYKHIRKFSVPTRQIGKYVYAPKVEIDNLYNQKQ